MDESANQPQPAPLRPFPGFAQALLVMLLFTVLSGLTGIPMVVMQHLGWSRAVPWAGLAGQLGGTALTLWICTSIGRQKWRDYVPHRSVAPMVWPLALLATAGIILLSNGAEGLIHRVLPAPEWLRAMFGDMGWPVVVVGAPLTEEPLFRGLIVGGFALRYGARKAILLSALLFALIHLNPWQLPTALAAGLFLGWLVLRTGSLWPGVLAHAFNNLAATLSETYRIPYFSDHQLQPLWMWALGTILLLLALWGLQRALVPEPERLVPEESLP